MKVQGATSVVEQMRGGNQTPLPLPEIPFQDLLAEAIQPNRESGQMGPDSTAEAQLPATDAPLSPESAVEEEPQEKGTSEWEVDELTMQNAAATMIRPQVVQLPDIPTKAPSAEIPIPEIPLPAAPHPAAPAQAEPAGRPLQTQPVVQEAAPQEVRQTDSQPVLPAAQPPEQTGNGITSTELVGQPQTHPAEQHIPAATYHTDPEAQARFDTMVQEASEKLLEKESPPESAQFPEEAKTAPLKTTETPVRTIPEELRRRSDIPEETLTMAAQPRSATEKSSLQPPQEVEAAPQAQIPPPVRQVETQVTEQLQEGKMEFHMQLNPQELGRITVKMLLEDGKLSVQIAAVTEKALTALRKESDGLLASLKMQGIQVERVQVVSETATASGHMESPFGMATDQRRGDSSAGQGHGARNDPAAVEDAPVEISQEALPDRLLDTAV